MTNIYTHICVYTTNDVTNDLVMKLFSVFLGWHVFSQPVPSDSLTGDSPTMISLGFWGKAGVFVAVAAVISFSSEFVCGVYKLWFYGCLDFL